MVYLHFVLACHFFLVRHEHLMYFPLECNSGTKPLAIYLQQNTHFCLNNLTPLQIHHVSVFIPVACSTLGKGCLLQRLVCCCMYMCMYFCWEHKHLW